jgi:hypothetical protein
VAEAAPIPNPTTPSWFSALLRLWLLRKVDAPPRGNPAWACGVLTVVGLAVWVAVDWWQRQPEPIFYIGGIPLLGWYGLGVVALATLLRSQLQPQPAPGATLVLVLGLTAPLVLLAAAAAYVEAAWMWGIGGCATIYALLFLARGLRALTGSRQRRVALIGAACVAIFAVASDAVDAIPDVWNPSDASSAVSDETIADRETALFEQADRIDEALESVHRGASSGPQAFFLGFAGVGDEKVFAQEVGLAARVLGERYDMDDRRLALINDERDLEHAPLASVSGLNYALRGLAKRMNVERDVLFLAISSHGSEDPAIAVANSGFPFTDLTDEDLATALHDSDIKWRVIIISACYAGGFIPALRDPQTIVITAAAADRTSFGCSNDSDLTYFGEAFYRDALPHAKTLRDAFEQAKVAIAAREQAEGETPSNPQAYFGAAMEAKLQAIGGKPGATGLAARAAGGSAGAMGRVCPPSTLPGRVTCP